MRVPYGDIPPDVTTRIREHRKAQGLSLETVAERVGVTRQTVQKWEVDGVGITVARLMQLANALGVHVQDLLPADPRLEDAEIVTDPAEKELLKWLRAAPGHDRKVLRSLAHSLEEARQAEFEHRPRDRKTGSG